MIRFKLGDEGTDWVSGDTTQGPQPGDHNKRIHISLDPMLHHSAKVLCAMMGTRLSTQIQVLLTQWIEQTSDLPTPKGEHNP